MKLIFICIALWNSIVIPGTILGQGEKKWNHEIGINLLQIPATTFDVLYSTADKPNYSVIINAGYTLNYAISYDYIGRRILSPHYKGANDGYSLKKQTGGFLKLGLNYNFRKTMEKKNYFFLSSFVTNSMIYERANCPIWHTNGLQFEERHHTLFVFGFAGAVGYTTKIYKKLHSDIGVHISIVTNNIDRLYGYCNYVPGIGYGETCENKTVFPMMVLNVKYAL